MISKKQEIIICKTCKKQFIGWKNYHRKFCSKKCSANNPIFKEKAKQQGLKNRIYQKINCKFCKKLFYPRYSTRQFCSIKCYSKSRIGSKCPEHSKRMKGRKRPYHSKQMMGDKNPNWNNGSQLEPYAPGWYSKILRQTIKQRDKLICQICKKINCKIYIHHIDYNKKNHNLNNLICLCASCHSKTNFNRQYWKKYFTKKA